MTDSTKSSPQRKIFIGAIAICISATLWGFDGVVLTPNLYNLRVDYVVFMLHLIPFVLMSLFMHKQFGHLRSFSKTDYLFFFLVALLGGAMGTLAIVKALFLVEFKKLTIVVLLQKLQPVFAIALAAILLREYPRKGFFLWAALAIVAGYFMTFGTKLPDVEGSRNMVFATLHALLAAFSFGSATVFSKRVLNKWHFKTATFYRYGFTTLIMFAIVLIAGSYTQILVTTKINWAIFFIIAATTGSGAIFLYYYGLRRVKAVIASICELCFPLSAILFDYFINDYKLSLVQWLGAAVLVFAIVKLNIRYSAEETNSKV